MGYRTSSTDRTRIYIQTALCTPEAEALAQAQALSHQLQEPVGLIVNTTEGLPPEALVRLAQASADQQAVIECTFDTLNNQGVTLIILHGAGNKEAKQALRRCRQLGHCYPHLSFVSLGSTVSGATLKQAVERTLATFLGQLRDWRDPTTYHALWLTALGAGMATGLLGLLGLVQTLVSGDGLWPALALALGGSVVTAGLLLWKMKSGATPRPIAHYMNHPHCQNILFHWQARMWK